MIQPTALGNVNKAAPGKAQGTEASATASFDLLLQMASGEAEGEQKAMDAGEGLVDMLAPFLLANQPKNLAAQANPSPIAAETKATGQDGAEAEAGLLRLQPKEEVAPQNEKQWNLSVLHKLTNATGPALNVNANTPNANMPNANVAIIAELQKVPVEKLVQDLEGYRPTDGSSITIGQQETEQKPDSQVVPQKETGFQNGKKHQAELLPEGFKLSAETGKEAAAFTPSETDVAAEAPAVADPDGQIHSNDSRPAHTPQHLFGSDVPVLRANQFEQDIKQIFQSALQQQAATEGKDGMKQAVSFQKLVDGTEAIIKLSPEHLGNIEVKVKFQDGQVKAEFFASTHQGKDLLETHVNALRSALEVQGLQVGKIDIQQQTSSGFMGAFSQRGDTNPRQGQQESRKRGEEKIPANEKYQDYGLDMESYSQINTTA
ncbi:hypothetical protein DRW41_15020 [Neobacillus piezotolerans]|uniref:Flagellar hook-length control protein-like C-terminal domain-containing protein n=2 Tax=Neobacillus piezotolerans TaxID=2259171 RepID=A0A3D8GN36_9BACI|nr:hypothetical protein DRW41_15020 [Neobacillus piezotolerans]